MEDSSSRHFIMKLIFSLILPLEWISLLVMFVEGVGDGVFELFEKCKEFLSSYKTQILWVCCGVYWVV